MRSLTARDSSQHHVARANRRYPLTTTITTTCTTVITTVVLCLVVFPFPLGPDAVICISKESAELGSFPRESPEPRLVCRCETCHNITTSDNGVCRLATRAIRRGIELKFYDRTVIEGRRLKGGRGTIVGGGGERERYGPRVKQVWTWGRGRMKTDK